MNHEQDIKNKLKESMVTSCDDALFFSDDESKLIDAEYLLTVNAAKAIKELNIYFGDPYNICLENDTQKFATSCTPLMVLTDNLKNVCRTSKNTQRPGNIDIAVYTDNKGIDTPLCAIEIKGFNPAKPLIIKDLERNAEYFGLTSPTGNSTLPFTFFIALHSYKGVWNYNKENSNILKVEQRYHNYINENNNLNKLVHNVEAFTIRRGVVPDPNDPYIQELGLQGDEDYHFIGVIITTKNK